jgi:hypothetical protein
VVYPTHVWLQDRRTYAVIVPMMWIISFLLLLPVYIWHDIKLITMKNTCFVAVHNIRGLIWCTVAIYGVPMSIISIVYLQLMRFMRRSSVFVSVRTKCDVVIVRRIVLVVFILMFIGVLTIVLGIMLPFTDVGKSLFYHISNITVVISSIALSVMLIYVSPKAKEILMRIGKQQQMTVSYILK